MYYFLKKEKFNLEKHDFNIQCIPKFTKKECEVFDILIRNYKPEAYLSEISIEKLKSTAKEIRSIIESLNKKSIILHVYGSEGDICILILVYSTWLFLKKISLYIFFLKE